MPTVPASFRRFTRVLVVLFTEEGRVDIALLSLRIDVPCEEAGRPERVLRLGAAILLLFSPLKDEADPL